VICATFQEIYCLTETGWISTKKLKNDLFSIATIKKLMWEVKFSDANCYEIPLMLANTVQDYKIAN
jgi:hypothetical protein